MSVELLYIECGYIDPYYIDGDEVCDIRTGGGGHGLRASTVNEMLARAWLPKKEPVKPNYSMLEEMLDSAGVEMSDADMRFLAEYMETLEPEQARYVALTAIQTEIDRRTEAQRLRDAEMAEKAEEQRLGYSPRKLNAAWAELTKTLN